MNKEIARRDFKRSFQVVVRLRAEQANIRIDLEVALANPCYRPPSPWGSGPCDEEGLTPFGRAAMRVATLRKSLASNEKRLKVAMSKAVSAQKRFDRFVQADQAAVRPSESVSLTVPFVIEKNMV